MKRIFTSESVTSGHPDKICDYIADSILDEAIAGDKDSHMAVECSIKDNFIFIFGEANTKADIDYETIAKRCLKEIGYNEEFKILVKVNRQSSEINNAVTNSEEMGAGDQGIMFGYACNETDTYMPLPIYLAHKLSRKLEEVRRKHEDILKPDGKTQVSVEYDDDKPVRVDTILVSTSHHENISLDMIKDIVINEVIMPSAEKYIDDNTRLIINPSGSFVLCGPFGDSGTTGRKIVVDTYGGTGRIGGGCFSSKDPSKVDRSAAYYARYVCKSLVANGLCDRCELEVAYAIGISKPVSIAIDTFGSSVHSDEELLEIINRNFDFSVSNIIKELDLQRPIYKETVNYGHFGKSNLPWERVKQLVI